MSLNRILIVDDDRATIFFHKYLINSIDSNKIVDSAINGKECVEKILKQEYDLILLDLKMPIYSGFEAIDVLREQNAKIPPIIMVTTSLHPQDKLKYNNYSEIEDFVMKPLTKDYLIKRLKA